MKMTHFLLPLSSFPLFSGDPSSVIQVPCPAPLSGRHRFSYLRHAEYPLAAAQCQHAASHLSACTRGSELRVAFRECSFPDREVRYQCLGDWQGRRGERFVALRDTDPEAGLQYRCALLGGGSEANSTSDSGEAVTSVAFSGDSTCHRDLFSSSLGHETLRLRPIPQPALPGLVRKGACRFPSWLQGQWEDVGVSGGAMAHLEQGSLRRVESHCIQRASKNRNRYLIYSRSPW